MPRRSTAFGLVPALLTAMVVPLASAPASAGTPPRVKAAIKTPGKLLSFGGTSAGSHEGSGTISVSVIREANGGEASVPFRAATPGNATPGRDYTPVSGTLTFAPGETLKTIEIPVIDDTAAEQPERITVALGRPTGDARVGPGTANRTVALIIDDDAARPVSKPEVTPTSSRVKRSGLTVAITTALDSTLVVTGSVSVPGASKVLRFKGAKAKTTGGEAVSVRLKVPRRTLALINGALRRRTLTATVRVTATDGVGRKSARRLRVKLRR